MHVDLRDLPPTHVRYRSCVHVRRCTSVYLICLRPLLLSLLLAPFYRWLILSNYCHSVQVSPAQNNRLLSFLN